jgi:hypothetical protein
MIMAVGEVVEQHNLFQAMSPSYIGAIATDPVALKN